MKNTIIEKFIEVHGNFYDYSLAEYVKSKQKIKIICPVHGEFEQTPALHKRGSGCMKCHKEKIKVTVENFIGRSKVLHNDKYDYKNVAFNNVKDKVKIICPTHGEFEQIVDTHLKGSGCKKCSDSSRTPKNKYTTESFIKKVNEVHDYKYDYTNTVYKGITEKVHVVCKEHGSFYQTAGNHKYGYGCPKCGHKRNSNYRKDSKDIFIEKSEKVHGEKYEYTKVEYIESKEKVVIKCKTHGEFSIMPYAHIQGQGCPNCGRSSGVSKPEQEIYDFVKSLFS